MIPVHSPALGEAERAALERCIDAGDAGGHSATVRSFEEQFARRVGCSHAVATSSGTAALHLAFVALGLGPGDEVIVPAFAFAPCADMILLSGATPVFVDSDPYTFNIDVDSVRAAITSRTRAVLAVHIYGHPCDLTTLADVCRAHGLHLVEDVAQGLGAQHAGRPVGSFGTMACYSFYANKVITTGEGGMVTTDDAAVADRVRWLRSHAQVSDSDRAYLHTALGFNYRLSAFGAAVGLAQLARIDEFLARKSSNAALYTEGLRDCPGVRVPVPPPEGDTHAHWAYAVLVDPDVVRGGSGGLAAYLHRNGYESRRFYYPLHLHPLAAATPPLELPACERFVPRGLVLPSGNALAPDDVRVIAHAVRSYAEA